MPWKENNVLDEKKRFVELVLKGEYTMTEICRAFEISRPTGYKCINRFYKEGFSGLKDLSSAPHTHPNETSKDIQALILEAKVKHPTWGPKKLIPWLEKRYPQVGFPVSSTASGILKRYGLVQKQRRRRRVPPYTQPFMACNNPNDIWSVDYKGWFRTKDGVRCDPLTITDGYSRFLLGCEALGRPNYEETKPVFERVFKEYGLPKAIRIDNGAPFASVGIGGLTRLSILWIKLGIIPERIEHGHPEQNPRHERMHRTLKMDATKPPKRNLREQQIEFDRFRYEYNYDRPHEALDQRTPASYYEPSLRIYPERVREVEYEDEYEVRRVRQSGEIKWRGDRIYLSESLIGEPVGLKQENDRYWQIYFGPIPLAILDDHTNKILRARPIGRADGIGKLPIHNEKV